MGLTDITAAEVVRATEEFDRLGAEVFLRDHGFRPARSYFLIHEGRSYDSKAILGVAHGFLPGRRALRPHELSGGDRHAAALLRGLGFAVVDRSAALSLEAQDLRDRVAALRTYQGSSGPALYQPIVLLWAIGRARRDEERLLPWEQASPRLQALLGRNGMRGERARPDYPVAALCRAGLWELHDHSGPVPAAHGDVALRRWFTEQEPRGGLTERAHALLRDSGAVRLEIVDALLTRFFADLDYDALLEDVGLHDDLADGASTGPDPAGEYARLCEVVRHREEAARGRRTVRARAEPIRSAAARLAVRLRCEGCCENPGCGGQPTDVTDRGLPILDVDHIDDIAAGGRDHPESMIALCPNCHAMKTRGRGREELRALLAAVALERHTRWKEPAPRGSTRD
ncbi:HNH endonuclease signature motif containing protein [Streptomyces sp. PA03-6a]|nr:HNH endonuclease signature motif containing protein [Streptomyces sp. PA03-6a]